MTSVGMHEAKTRLSQLVKEVEEGGEVEITRHGRVVAKLVRPTPPDSGRRRSLGFGSMTGSVPAARLTWEYLQAGDAEVLEMFGLDGPVDPVYPVEQ